MIFKGYSHFPFNIAPTGPQGEPGNIADAAITDTQGLDVAKGAKTTAQKLFDAIADRIVNKLVTNDTLTTKLADYLLKSAMSSTNIDSTTNVPTSALVYSLMQDVNNNLSNAGIPTVKNITDLYAIKKSGFYCYDAGASNAPMSSRGGMVIANYLSDAWISLNVVPYALSKIYTNSKYNSTWTGWSELASKDDLPNIFTTTLGTSNQESNHATTIKRLWNSFPERQVFACNLVDSNNFCVFGFTYGNHKYGAVLYLAFNSCGIVKCINGNFSDTEL